MIESSVKKFNYFFSIIGFLGGIVFAIYITQAAIYKTIVPVGRNQIPAIILSYTASILVTIIYGKLLWDCKILLIDTEQKKIKMTNRFTRNSTTFDFNYFDGSVIINELSYGGWSWVRNYYLIKDRKAIKRINNFIYSNQNEIEEGLSGIKSLGEIKYSYLNSAKILFGLPIISTY